MQRNIEKLEDKKAKIRKKSQINSEDTLKSDENEDKNEKKQSTITNSDELIRLDDGNLNNLNCKYENQNVFLNDNTNTNSNLIEKQDTSLAASNACNYNIVSDYNMLSNDVNKDTKKAQNEETNLNIDDCGDFIDEDLLPNQYNISTEESSSQMSDNDENLNNNENVHVSKHSEIKSVFNLEKFNALSENLKFNYDLLSTNSQNKQFSVDDYSHNITSSSSSSSFVLSNFLNEDITSIEDHNKIIYNETHPNNNFCERISEIESDECEETYIWSDVDAVLNQIPQIGASNCATTAILNVLKALNYEFDYNSICCQIRKNSRVMDNDCLPQYLFSRSNAGMNAHELIDIIENVTNSKISGRFFSFYPQRDINLIKWLKKWIQKGAVPVALLNLQRVAIWGFIPDSWHHQMIYGCNSNCVYLTNPIECKEVDLIMKELTSDSILLIRTFDILKRFDSDNCNLIDLIKHNDSRWQTMNVLGQIINVLRECKMNNDYLNKNNNQATNSFDRPLSSPSSNIDFDLNDNFAFNYSSANNRSLNNFIKHIEIPCNFTPGITLFSYKNSSLFKELLDANELPIKQL